MPNAVYEIWFGLQNNLNNLWNDVCVYTYIYA